MSERTPNNYTAADQEVTPANRQRSDEIDRSEGQFDQAQDAVSDMEAREARRDAGHRTGGDDHNPGVDTKSKGNAPKSQDRD